MVAHHYKAAKWASLIAYGFASAVTGAHVAASKHHVSEVFAGAGAGYLTGRFMSRAHDDRDGKRGFAILPRVIPELDGVRRSARLGLVWTWQ